MFEMAQETKDTERLISGLKEGTGYRFEVSAENAWGVVQCIGLICIKEASQYHSFVYFQHTFNIIIPPKVTRFFFSFLRLSRSCQTTESYRDWIHSS